MNKVLIYSKPVCPYCVKAKNLFQQLGMPYDEKYVSASDDVLQEMLSKSNGMRTVPQIFIGDKHIGGCDDLYALHEKGELKSFI